MTNLLEIQQFLKQPVTDLISSSTNWCHECMLGICKICAGDLPDDDHFHLFMEVGDETWCMDFHYACAIIDSHSAAFRDANIDGWIAHRAH